VSADDSSSDSAAAPTVVPSPLAEASSFTPAESEKLAASAEKFEFQAEVSRLMDIIINRYVDNFSLLTLSFSSS